MAKAATDEQVQLRRRARRRLIGAIALVTLIAVILPWILESEPRSGDQEIAIQIPSQDSATFAERVVPGKVSEAPKAPAETGKPATADTAATPAQPDALKAEQDKVLAAPLPKAREKSASGKEQKATSAAEAKKKAADRTDAVAADSKQFVVQVAALADAGKAGSIQKELAAKGLKAYTEVIATTAGEVTRVRVGPFPDRESAEQERTRMKSLGVDGNVAPR
jgi:DedD protein